MSRGNRETRIKGYLLLSVLAAIVAGFTGGAIWQSYVAATTEGSEAAGLIPLLWIASVVGWAVVIYSFMTFRRQGGSAKTHAAGARHVVPETRKHRRPHHRTKGRRA